MRDLLRGAVPLAVRHQKLSSCYLMATKTGRLALCFHFIDNTWSVILVMKFTARCFYEEATRLVPPERAYWYFD